LSGARSCGDTVVAVAAVADPPFGAVGACPATTIAAAPKLRAIGLTTAAHACNTMRIRIGTHISASAAVVGIGIQDAALAVADHSTLDAGIQTGASKALAKLVRTRVGATEAAASAVVEVILQIGTVGPATRLAINAAIVAASPAVWVGLQVAAHSVASCGGTTGVIAT